MVRRMFGYSKARYRGIAKNAARIWALLASANLPCCADIGRQGEFPTAYVVGNSQGRGPGRPSRAPNGSALPRGGLEPQKTEPGPSQGLKSG